MEKIKELFDAAISYCRKEPFHAVIVIGLAVFILAVIAALIVLAVKRKKAPIQAENQSGTETPSEKSPLCAEERSEQAPQEEFEQEEEVKEIQPAPAPIVEEISEEKTEPLPEPKAKIEEEKTEPKAEKTPDVEIRVTPLEKATRKQAKTDTAKTADGKKSNNKKDLKEGTMLHEELKDINVDLDFYEEDETDKVARYSGKWVICRVVTNDSENEDMYFFELHASNGEKLLSSEEYTTYNGAIRGIETHKSNILRGNFRISLSKKGDYIFKLLNGKGMLLCMGEHYATKASCESAIESAKRFARTAFVDENIQDIVVKVPAEDHSEPAPLPEGYNGKWVIDCHVSPEGDKVFYFELFANNGERLLSSEEYSSYIGAVNGIQTHKMNIKNGNFRVFLTKHGDYIYKLLNGNGQLLCLGEHYKTKRRCENAVESVKRFAMNSPILTDPELTKE